MKYLITYLDDRTETIECDEVHWPIGGVDRANHGHVRFVESADDGTSRKRTKLSLNLIDVASVRKDEADD